MLNFRVSDLDAMVVQLCQEFEVKVDPETRMGALTDLKTLKVSLVNYRKQMAQMQRALLTEKGLAACYKNRKLEP